MMNLNDTISAFRCCTQIPPMCKECPLTEMCKWNLSKDRCKNEVKLSVNHWLKAQEPRVMTVNEISALDNGSVVWIEFTDGRLLPMIVEDGVLMRWMYLWRICEDAFCDEDYRARAWTSRPDEKRRAETPWEQ